MELTPPPRPRPARREWAIVAALVLVVLVLVPLACGPLARPLITAAIRGTAASRGYAVTWAALEVRPPLRLRFRTLTVTRVARGDTLVRAESLAVSVDPWPLLLLRPRLTSLDLAHAAIRMPGSHRTEPDTLAPEATARRDRRDDPRRAARVRDLARALVRLLVAPARELPRLALRDVVVTAGPAAAERDPKRAPASRRGRRARAAEETSPSGAHIAWLEMTTAGRGLRLAARGRLLGGSPIPFEVGLDYGRDDRITGGARFDMPAAEGGAPDPLRITVDGALRQDRHAGRVAIDDSTRITIGTLRFRLGGEAAVAGPSFRLGLSADRLTAAQWKESLPRATLGPLMDLSVRGWYAYHVNLDLDLAQPDSVQFDADVEPHGLALDSTGTGSELLALDHSFVAGIHLPRDRIVPRDLSPGNPHFRPLAEMDSVLVRAVVTNEDGGFYRHGGFNTEAVKSSIADNLRAGAFRRGAGTITMQLVRNLYLGHARTLSRKGQEVVLAWVLEHLTRLTKERMLEIYLNIIEWGPEVHGADEATHYYFGHDAGRVTVDEALFLATVVPAPTRWRNRFEPTGELRPFARTQMHFIGRAMVHKGWLPAERLPAAESLRVELRGPAGDSLRVVRGESVRAVTPAPSHGDSTSL